MTIITEAVLRNTTTAGIKFAQGWVGGPDGRGTWDIVRSCAATLILCSWSSLVLNVFHGKSHRSKVKDKGRWMLFTLFWPEITAGVAFEQWESASQCVADFARLKIKDFEPWTMRHAFLADMGGIMLAAPDFPPFPVDGQQVLFLYQNGYIPYPRIRAEEIWDKNKTDGFVRAITLIQVTWFTVQCIGRAIQRLGLSTLELLTVNMIFCTIFTFYFWHHKPQDIDIPFTLTTGYPIAEILVRAGPQAREPYKLTPLDFVTAKPDRTNFVAAWWWGLVLSFDGKMFRIYDKQRPVQTFSNSRAAPPRGYSVLSLLTRTAISTSYFLLHFAGWNFAFPTAIEQTLWRAATGFFIALFVGYIVIFIIVTSLSSWLAQRYYGKDADTFIELASMLPLWVQRAILIPIYGSYGVVRTFVVVEALINLRKLPIEIYATVDWADFIPHW
ncbi:hypothetical protein MMC25_005344 [Agyrium rufum]|nr:hypothetical protein [Agyrium rufum]